MENIAVLVFCVLAIPFAIGWFIGYLHRGSVERGKWKRGEYQAPTLPVSGDNEPLESRPAIIRDYLNRPDVVHVLGPERWSTLVHRLDEPVPPAIDSPPVVVTTPMPVPAEAPPASPIVVLAAPPTTTTRAPITVRLPVPRTVADRDTTPLEPAVLLLYLGALLIVAAGIIFASYAWGTLGPWQKVGLLMTGAGTFLAAGYGLRNVARIARAAETFLAIGALLIPAVVIAAYAVFEGEITNPAIPLCLGATVIALVYTVFSLDPGGALYRIGAPIGAVPAALGFEPTWAAATMLTVIGVLPAIGGRLRHLDDVWRPIGWFGSTIASIWMLGEAVVDYTDGFDDLPWTVAVTAAILTAVMLRRWRETGDDTWAITASVSGLIAVGTAMISAQVESDLAWAGVASVIAVACVAIADRLRDDPTRSALAFSLLVESLLAFAFAAGLILDDDPGALTTSATFAVPMLAYAWTAVRRRERWWLLVSAIASTMVVFPLLGTIFPDADERTTVPIVIAGYVTMVAAAALATSFAARRAGDEAAFALPVWIWAGIVASIDIVLQIVAVAEDDSAIHLQLALIAILFGVLALVAAWSMTMVPIRAFHGLFATTAVLALARWPDLRIEDRFPLALALALLVAAPSLPRVAARLRRFPPLVTPQPPLELGALGITGVASLLAIVGSSLVHLGNPDRADAPGVWWTWVIALGVFLALAGLGLIIGRRGFTLPWHLDRWLPEWTLAWTGYTALFAATLVTRDVQILTWFGFVLAGLMAVAPDRASDHAYLSALVARTRVGGLVVGAVAGVINLQATMTRYDERDLAQTVIYAAIALGLIGYAAQPGQRYILYLGFVTAGIALGFGVRAADATPAMTALLLMIGAWGCYGTMLALPAARRWQRDSWVVTAVFVALVAVPIATGAWRSPAVFEQTIIVLALANVGVVLGIEGRRRSAAPLLYAASGFGMLAIFAALQLNEVAHVHAYSLPLAAYAFVLAWCLRRDPAARDLLTTIGAVSLVGPPVALALREQSFMWLVVTLVEAVALVMGGAIARLRMAIAIGIAAVTLIVLRLLVDAANALPSWATLLVLGLVMLAAGTIWITLRDDLRDRRDTLHERWKALA